MAKIKELLEYEMTERQQAAQKKFNDDLRAEHERMEKARLQEFLTREPRRKEQPCVE